MKINLDIQSLRSFIKVSEIHNFTKAGEVLYLTQPAISQQIRRLEDLLNVELFVRDHKQVLLTLEGERLLNYAKEIVSTNDNIGMLFGIKDSREIVTLGMPEHFCETVLPYIISDMARRFPDIQIVVKVDKSTLISEAVNEGKVDIGIILDDIDNINENIWHKVPVKWFSSDSVHSFDKNNIPLALFNPPCGFRSLAISSLEKNGIGWYCSYESDDLMSLRSAILAGVGVTVLPYITEINGLNNFKINHYLPALPPFGVSLKQKNGWNPSYKRDIIKLIYNTWMKNQAPLP